MCNVLSLVNRKENSLIKIVISQMLRSMDRAIDCPIRKGRVAFKNFHVDGSQLPSLIPSGLYYAYLNFLTTENGVKIIILKAGFDVKVESL